MKKKKLKKKIKKFKKFKKKHNELARAYADLAWKYLTETNKIKPFSVTLPTINFGKDECEGEE